MKILGITSPWSYNQAACLLIDGELIGWGEEERFIRVKHGFLRDANEWPGTKTGETLSTNSGAFPIKSINMCLDRAQLTMDDIDIISIGYSDLREVLRAEKSQESLEDAREMLAGTKFTGIEMTQAKFFDIARHEIRVIEGIYNILKLQDGTAFDIDKVEWMRHANCHAISAILPSKFESCNYVVCDGDGGQDAGVYGFFDGKTMNHLGSYNPLGTIGGWYTDATEVLGFRPHSAEGKLMGLAAYGKVDEDLVPEKFYKLSKGVLLPNTNWYKKRWFEFTEQKKKEIKNNSLGKDATNFAATIQTYLEKIMLHNCKSLYEKTGSKKFAVSGGTFLNCSMNGLLLQQDFVDELYVQPASHDSGTAFGSALLAHQKHTGSWPKTSFETPYWGSEFTNSEITDFLNKNNIQYKYIEDAPSKIAELINKNLVIGLLQGRSEIGPRALCNRSILANPTIKENLDRVNKIKKREHWRPLSPVIAEEYYHDIVDIKHTSPYMLIAGPVKKEWKKKIPAVVHVDGSCRPQSVNKSQNPFIHKALLKFNELSGVPVFLNTSFNIDEPLVDTPQDALETFQKSELDVLFLQNFLISK
jgi:carbamoyltransferase